MEFSCQRRIERPCMKTKASIVRNCFSGFSLYTLIAVLFAAGGLKFAGTARATDFHWVNPGGGDWSNTNNWRPPTINPPGSGDNATIDWPGTYNVTGSANVRSLSLGDGVA